MPDNSLRPVNFPKELPKKEEEKLHIWEEKLGLTSPDLESFLPLPLRQLELALELLSTGVDAGGDGGGRYLRIYFAPSFNEASLRKPWAGIHVSAHKSRSAHGCD